MADDGFDSHVDSYPRQSTVALRHRSRRPGAWPTGHPVTLNQASVDPTEGVLLGVGHYVALEPLAGAILEFIDEVHAR